MIILHRAIIMGMFSSMHA